MIGESIFIEGSTESMYTELILFKWKLET